MIGVIADTHDNIPNILNAMEVFKAKKVTFVIHLGDVIAPKTVTYFKGIPMRFIKGNNDGDIEGIKRKCEEIGAEYLGEFAMLNIKGKRIALYHGTDQKRLSELIASGEYQYVLHGHDHRKRFEKINMTRVLNPGGHYYQSENTIALLDFETDKVTFVDVKG